MFPAPGAWLAEGGKPAGGVHIMAGLDNKGSPTADPGGPVVAGLARAGDALVHTLTQGATLALWAARKIAATAGTTADHHPFAGDYARWVERVLKPGYSFR
ncbi:hypothetical protein AB0L14_21705 [Streptomyces sp. NPDC052727]|uniref:hypothetical protein n=1 Tax=Streptomyces sp. NPDC052727 TaxID=3154854 RepID=UPI003432C8ED